MDRLAIFLLGLFAMTLAAGCSSNPYYDPAKPHHTPDGFRNNYPHPEKGSLLKWKWDQFWDDLPEEVEGGYHPEVLEPDLDALIAKRLNPSITWIGHATLLVQMGGLNVLTDPHLTERASPFTWAGPRRRVRPALTLEQLPHIDLVVISHNHYDHLDEGTVVGLRDQPGGPPQFFVPLGLKPWFAELDVDTVSEMDWWSSTDHRGLRVNFVPVQHWSGRSLFRSDVNETLWGGWILESPGFRFFFAGDTGYSRDFADIAGRFGPIDLAAIPIGAYEPRWFMKVMHVNPEEAIRIHQDVAARYSVGLHWGTFQLTDETIDEPPKQLALAREAAGVPPEEFFVLKHGETRSIEPPLALER
ncbi:MAG: MBL fold metallo-hydrolase [SAR324 cluster bacterium]|nr:MBL fold metallo-hydrolase [SAR324 cluster bacterium]